MYGVNESRKFDLQSLKEHKSTMLRSAYSFIDGNNILSI